MNESKVRIALSFIIILSYLTLIFVVLRHETMSNSNSHEHPNDMMGELKILIGVLTAGVAQILNYWFSGKSRKDPGSKAS